MTRLEFEIPPPISLNNAYFNVKGSKGRKGGRRLTPEARAYKESVGWAVKAAVAAAAAGWEAAPPYAFVLRIWFSDRSRRRDVDNRIKLALDAVCEALGFDDELVEDIRVIRCGIDPIRPRGEVAIWGLGTMPLQGELL